MLVGYTPEPRWTRVPRPSWKAHPDTPSNKLWSSNLDETELLEELNLIPTSSYAKLKKQHVDKRFHEQALGSFHQLSPTGLDQSLQAPWPWLPNQKDLCVPIGRITRGAVKVSTKTDRLDGGTKGGIFDPEAKGKKKKSLSSPLGQFLVVPDDPDEDWQLPQETGPRQNKAFSCSTGDTQNTNKADKSAETERQKKQKTSLNANLEFWACGSAGSNPRDC